MPDEKIETNEFSSQTERTIYTYLSLHYPTAILSHNIKDVYEPYEIDFSIQLLEQLIYIEFNGVLHCSNKSKNLFSNSLINFFFPFSFK